MAAGRVAAAIALAMLHPCGEARGDERGFMVVERGRAVATVVIADTAAPMELEAAEEMVRVVQRMTGTTLEIQRDPARTGPTLEIGRTAHARAAGLPPGDLSADGFVLRVEPDRVLVTGANPWSTAFGVAWLLESEGGVRWFFPGPLGETPESGAPGVRSPFSSRSFSSVIPSLGPPPSPFTRSPSAVPP